MFSKIGLKAVALFFLMTLFWACFKSEDAEELALGVSDVEISFDGDEYVSIEELDREELDETLDGKRLYLKVKADSDVRAVTVDFDGEEDTRSDGDFEFRFEIKEGKINVTVQTFDNADADGDFIKEFEFEFRIEFVKGNTNSSDEKSSENESSSSEDKKSSDEGSSSSEDTRNSSEEEPGSSDEDSSSSEQDMSSGEDSSSSEGVSSDDELSSGEESSDSQSSSAEEPSSSSEDNLTMEEKNHYNRHVPADGKTLVVIGQEWMQDFKDYNAGVGIPAAGSSHYGDFFKGTINSGDDEDNQAFLSYVNDTYPGAYAELGIRLRDQDLDAIAAGNMNEPIDGYIEILNRFSNLKFLMRIGYELASHGPGQRPSAYKAAYNYIANYIRNEKNVTNVTFVFHTIRGPYYENLYPGDEFVDWFGLSIFNHDICIDFDGMGNCQGQEVDANITLALDYAAEIGKPIIIAEAAVQANPSQASDINHFNTWFDRTSKLIEKYDIKALVYINILWDAPNYNPPRTWGPGWGDSRVEQRNDVLESWMDFVGTDRYLHYDHIK